MIAESDAIHLAQQDDNPPQILASGRAPGESGVTVMSARFRGRAHLSMTARRHLVFFSSGARFACNIAGQKLMHDAPPGSLAICPLGVDAVADAGTSVESHLVAIDAGRLALAAAEDCALEARLEVRLTGYDAGLLGLARTLISESKHGYPSGALFWNEAASRFIDGVVARHTGRRAPPPRGALGSAVLSRLRDHIMAHLDEPIEVATLAGIAGRSPFHFSRVFAEAVGMTPHRYIVHLRLRRAVELMRERRHAAAEIAARTGFADQSHLSRWIRRVHGVAPGDIAA